MEYPGENPNNHNIEKLLVCVDYPGKVNNVEKAVETMGGIEEISKAFYKDKKKLEVRFRPNDVYCRKVTAEKTNATGVLLKVVVNKELSSGKRTVKESSIVGITNETYQFNSLCDYNYLPIVKVKGKTEFIYPDLVPTGVLNSNYVEEKPNVPIFLPPGSFSRIDTPQTGLFKKQESEIGTMNDTKDNVIGVNRQRRQTFAICIPFSLTAAIPKKPSKSAHETLSLKMMPQEKIDAVRQAFETRPIWTRLGLIEYTKISYDNIKVILPIIAYYYSSGPWRTCWIKFGYDPRENVSSKYFQPLDFRLRNASGVKRDLEIQRGASKAEKVLVEGGSIFEENTIPIAKLTFYQYCDIKIPKIQNMLSNISDLDMQCNEKRGWLPPGFDDDCRGILSEIVKNNYKAEFQKDLDLESTQIDEPDDDLEDDVSET